MARLDQRQNPLIEPFWTKGLRLRVNATAHAGFVRLALATPSARQQIEDGATGSSRSMKNISQEKLRSVVLPQPAWDEQVAIAESIDGLAARIGAEQAYTEGLREAKSALMSVLLPGAVRVKPDEAPR